MAVHLCKTTINASSAAIEAQLKARIPHIRDLTSLDDLPLDPNTESANHDIVVVIATTFEKTQLTKIKDIAYRAGGRPFLLLVSDEISAVDYKSLIRTGGADWVATEAAPREVFDIIARQTARLQETPPKSKDPIIVSFLPSAGGVGNATLAIEVASNLISRKQRPYRSICIVDLDFQTSHVCDYLDIEPRLKIEEISRNPERLDRQLFDIFVSKHASGLEVISAPRGKFNVCDLNVTALDRLFAMTVARYELVLVDLPVTWFPWTSDLIAGSNACIVTGLNSIPGLRQMAEAMDSVRQICKPSCRVAIAVNRCDIGLMGRIARRNQIEKVLGRQNVFCIRRDSAITESANVGSPVALTAPSRKICKEIAMLANLCVVADGAELAGTSS